MNRHSRLLTLVAIGTLVGSLGWAKLSLAQQATKLSISPVTFELNANPGDTLTNEIKVTNLSDANLELDTHVENISGASEQGQVQLTEEETQFSLSSWVTTSPSTLTLAPKEVKTVNYTIKVPKNAEPGGHYGSILVGTIASDKLNTTGAAVAQRVGSLLLVRVSGDAKELAQVNRFQTKTFSGTFDGIATTDNKKIFVSRDENFSQETHKTYYQNGPIAFDLLIQNRGNIHVKPAGFVSIYNIFNKKIADLPIDSRNVFPGGQRRITVIWPKKQLWGVYYRAQFAAVYGDTHQPLTASTTFWAFPLWAAITLLVLLVIFFILRKRLSKAIRILMRGE
jgi:hypothetical protein